MFSPDKRKVEALSAGEIGYIVTGLKKPGIASVGDTLTLVKHPLPPLPGYQEPRPVVWASLYPESQDDFDALKDGLQKLKLSDSSLVFEEETSGTLGRGWRCGFLGMLHLEIIAERLRREFGLELIVTTPSINYEVTYQNGETKTVYSPAFFPDHGAYKEVREPWAKVTVITPPEYVSPIMQLFFEHEAEIGDSALFGEKRISLSALMPLRELMRNFFDRLKSVSSGFASLSYEVVEHRRADVARLDILVAEEAVPAFAKVVSVRRINEEAEKSVEKLHSVLPRQLFVVKIQGKALGRIISSRTLSALKKDVTGYLYGGDITRKMKLREKQKKGKKKMKLLGRVDIPKDVFLKVMKD
jgi:GTP-binding protein LepA